MGRTRRISTITAIVGVALLWVACAAFVFLPLGTRDISTTTADGTPITRTERTSMWETDRVAVVAVAQVVVGFSIVALVLIRFGGIPGAFLVGLCCGLGLLASMMSVGIFLVPGASCLGVASVLSIADRFERRALRRSEQRFAAPAGPVAPT